MHYYQTVILKLTSFPVLANLCSIPAMWFFVNKEKNSNVTPAESREKNQPCTLLDFYDG